MADRSLLDELDEAEHCRCGKTHEECEENGGCWWAHALADMEQLRRNWHADRDKLVAVRKLADSLGDRSGEMPRDGRASDWRVVAPIQRITRSWPGRSPVPDTLLAARPSGTTSAPELLHIVCCDDDTALCGQDVSADSWADNGEVCVTCEIEWVLGSPCPVNGCFRGRNDDG